MFKINKINRSTNTPAIIKDVINDINRKSEAIVKSASTEVVQPPTKIKLDEASAFLKSCKNHGMGVYEANNGNVWKVAIDADGSSWIEIDDDLTMENNIVNDIIKNANIEKKKLAATLAPDYLYDEANPEAKEGYDEEELEGAEEVTDDDVDALIEERKLDPTDRTGGKDIQSPVDFIEDDSGDLTSEAIMGDVDAENVQIPLKEEDIYLTTGKRIQKIKRELKSQERKLEKSIKNYSHRFYEAVGLLNELDNLLESIPADKKRLADLEERISVGNYAANDPKLLSLQSNIETYQNKLAVDEKRLSLLQHNSEKIQSYFNQDKLKIQTVIKPFEDRILELKGMLAKEGERSQDKEYNIRNDDRSLDEIKRILEMPYSSDKDNKLFQLANIVHTSRGKSIPVEGRALLTDELFKQFRTYQGMAGNTEDPDEQKEFEAMAMKYKQALVFTTFGIVGSVLRQKGYTFKNPDDREDLKQNLVASLVKSINSYDGSNKFSTYAYKSLAGVLNNFYKSLPLMPVSKNKQRDKIQDEDEQLTYESIFRNADSWEKYLAGFTENPLGYRTNEDRYNTNQINHMQQDVRDIDAPIAEGLSLADFLPGDMSVEDSKVEDINKLDLTEDEQHAGDLQSVLNDISINALGDDAINESILRDCIMGRTNVEMAGVFRGNGIPMSKVDINNRLVDIIQAIKYWVPVGYTGEPETEDDYADFDEVPAKFKELFKAEETKPKKEESINNDILPDDEEELLPDEVVKNAQANSGEAISSGSVFRSKESLVLFKKLLFEVLILSTFSLRNIYNAKRIQIKLDQLIQEDKPQVGTQVDKNKSVVLSDKFTPTV